jgi:hypothetical protein
MLKQIFEYIYILTGVLFALSIIYGKMFVFKKKDATYVSDYCASIAVFTTAYVIFSLVNIILMPTMLDKLFMLLFGASPFLLGFLATYHTEKYFTAIQILVICASIYSVWV